MTRTLFTIASLAVLPSSVALLAPTAMPRARPAVSEGAASTIDSGARIWDAGRLLSRLLLERTDLSGLTVLELGSGTGVGGLSAAAAGATTVVLTDGESSMIPLLEANIAANGFHRRGGVTSAKLRWGDDDDIEAVSERYGPFDLIVGSDLLYNPAVSTQLVDTLAALSTPGVTEVILTYPTRQTEGIFLDEAYARFDEIEWPAEVEDAMWAARLRLRDE